MEQAGREWKEGRKVKITKTMHGQSENCNGVYHGANCAVEAINDNEGDYRGR